MKQLNNFDFKRGAGRPQKYPWDKWEDGSVWEIEKGEDYEIEVELRSGRNAVRRMPEWDYFSSLHTRLRPPTFRAAPSCSLWQGSAFTSLGCASGRSAQQASSWGTTSSRIASPAPDTLTHLRALFRLAVG